MSARKTTSRLVKVAAHQVRGDQMRVASIWREGWRNFVSGTSYGLLFAALFALAVGGLAATQARSVVSLVQDALAFRSSGAAVTVLTLIQGIDGAQCDVLSSAPGVMASGALRAGPKVKLAALPSRGIESLEVTAGFGQLLDLSRGSGAWGDGVWVASDLAQQLRLTANDAFVPLANGDTLRVDGVYEYPNDGRSQTLAYEIVSPVAPVGVFDSCWALLWPEQQSASAIMQLAVLAQPGVAMAEKMMPQSSQLNSTFGLSFDGLTKFKTLSTAPLTWIALIIGIGLGFIAIRRRRLELAGALHTGLSKTSLSIQILIETSIWLIAATVPTVVVLVWLSIDGNTFDWMPAFFPAIRTVTLGVSGALVGSQIALWLTKEHHLFRYFKNR